MKKKDKANEPTTFIRVWVKAHRAMKIEAAQKGVPMTQLVSEKLLSSSAA